MSLPGWLLPRFVESCKVRLRHESDKTGLRGLFGFKFKGFRVLGFRGLFGLRVYSLGFRLQALGLGGFGVGGTVKITPA